MAQIPHCYGCREGQQLQLRFDPWPGNFHTPQEKKKKKKSKNKKQKKKKQKKYGKFILKESGHLTIILEQFC